MNTTTNKSSSLAEGLNGRPLRLLIGGSPCTYWSIAQKNNRETEAEGLGWELFKNYLIARDKFQPDFFLYENNKSAAQPIKDQISEKLGVDLQYINSALVSAQQRQRFYAHNIPDVEQPKDRGLLLKDVLEHGIVDEERGYYLRLPVEKSRKLSKESSSMLVEPIRIATIDSEAKNKKFDSQQYRVYSPEGKSVTICGQGGGMGAKTGLYATPVNITSDSFKHLSEKEMDYMTRSTNGKYSDRWAFLNKSTEDKSMCLVANLHKGVPYNILAQEIEYVDFSKYKNVEFLENGNIVVDDKIIYLVINKEIGHKDGLYSINLPDGYYIIRKLTPIECERLQTLPDNYTEGVSNTQRYKGIGNGWTAEVIIHILSHINIPKDYPIEVLSMYDGIGTGRYVLEKLGYTNITYKAYEIDEYAMKVATKNYPDIIQCGDAFQVREDNWVY